MSKLPYTGSYKPGDRVRCLGDNIDGSYEGEEGTVIEVYRQSGGSLAPERNMEVVVWDCDAEGDLDTEEARAVAVASHEDGALYAVTSDDFDFEAA